MLTTQEERGKTYVDLSFLSIWEKNPKYLMKEDRNRLTEQILDLGQYKPLLVLGEDAVVKGDTTPQGAVIGGNARYLVYSEQAKKDGAFSKVWVSILTFQFIEGEAMWYPVINGEVQDRRKFNDPLQIMIEYSQSDNDQAGRTDRQALAELVLPYQKVLPLENYKIQVFDQKPLKDILDEYQAEPPKPSESPSEAEEQGVVNLLIKFTPEQYEQVEPVIDRIKEQYGIRNNTDLFQQLLNVYNSHVAQTIKE